MLFEGGGGVLWLYTYVRTYCSMCNNLVCYIHMYNYNVDLLSDATSPAQLVDAPKSKLKGETVGAETDDLERQLRALQTS